jgi:hypothetical protein
MHFLDHVVFGLRDIFNTPRHLMQLFQHCVLPGRDAMHPPKTNNPAGKPGPRKQNYYHF